MTPTAKRIVRARRRNQPLPEGAIYVGRDRYGRTLARITVNGTDAGHWLIGRGLARRWQ